MFQFLKDGAQRDELCNSTKRCTLLTAIPLNTELRLSLNLPALHVQHRAAFQLLSTSFNAIPVNLPNLVGCTAFAGDETSVSD